MSIIHDALKKLEREKLKGPPQEGRAPDLSLHLPAPAATSSPPSTSRSEGRREGQSWRLPVSPFRKNLLGIDIGSSSIKVVKLKQRGGACTLTGVGSEKLPPEASGPLVSEALRTLLKVQGIGSGRVASAIDGKSLTFRDIRLPKMPEGDLREAVRWEIKKGIDFSEDAVIDYVVNDELIEGGKTTLSILAFAVKKEEVSGHVGILKEASLIPDAIDVGPMALLSAFDYNYSEEKEKRYAILDIGASKTTLAIIFKSTLRFTRYIPLGGNDITTAFQNAEGGDFQAAEEEKVRYAPVLDEAPEAVQSSIKSFIEGLSQELRNSLRYYQAQLREGAVDGILVSGGCSRIKGIAGYLENALGIPTALYDTMRGVKINVSGSADIHSLSPLLAIAFGLALRKEGE